MRHTKRYTETGRLETHTHTEGNTLIQEETHTPESELHTEEEKLKKERETHTHTLRGTHKH